MYEVEWMQSGRQISFTFADIVLPAMNVGHPSLTVRGSKAWLPNLHEPVMTNMSNNGISEAKIGRILNLCKYFKIADSDFNRCELQMPAGKMAQDSITEYHLSKSPLDGAGRIIQLEDYPY